MSNRNPGGPKRATKKSASSWRAFNPGWLKRGSDTDRQHAIAPLHSRLVRK